MEVDFCPVLCIVEMPVLQAFGVFSRFVWYRQIYRKCRKFVVKKWWEMEKLGKYGFLRRDYLKNHKNSLYQVMLLQDTIGKHLLEVDKAAREREEVILKHKTISRRFLFSDYNRRSRIFEVPIWHLKNTRVRKKGWTRWQTYATVCIYRAGNINASQCIT